MNEQSKELMHWGLELGAKKQGHKYIARVEGKKPGSYLYFYDMDKYNAWKNGAKSKLNETTNKVSSTLKGLFYSGKKKIEKNVKSISKQASSLQTKVTDATKKYEKYIKDVKDAVGTSVEKGKKVASQAKSAVQNVTDFVNSFKNTPIQGNKSSSKQAKSFVSNLFHLYTSTIGRLGEAVYNTFNKANKDTTPMVVSTKDKTGKLDIKLQYPDGSERHIKTKEQWDRYAETVRYQNNEPEFMHSLPEIKVREDGSLPSMNEDRDEVNEKRNTDDSKPSYRDVNCIYCSTAYELRRRGYDVEAANIPSNITGTTISKLYDVKDSTLKMQTDTITTSDPYTGGDMTGAGKVLSSRRNDDGTWTHKIQHVVYEDHDDNVMSFTPATTVKNAFNPVHDGSYDKEWVKDITRQVKDATSKFPEGSRGMVNLYWKDGGGHSVVWEKDESGEIKFLDTQVQNSFPIEALLWHVSPMAPMQFVRTDNLQLSRRAMACIVSN